MIIAISVAILAAVFPCAFIASLGFPETMRAFALWQLRKAHSLARFLLNRSRAMEAWRLQRDRHVRKALAEEL